MSLKRKISAGMDAVFSRLPFQLVQTDVFCPFYHCVANTPGDHLKHLFPIRDPRTFLADLEFLARSFTPITLNNMIAHAREDRPVSPRAMFLSFDDGLREIANEIAPLCTRVGVPATFFVNSASVDNRILCFRHKASLLIETLFRSGPSSIREVARLTGLPDDASPDDVIRKVAAARAADTPILDRIAVVVGVDFEAFLHRNQPYLTSEEIQTLRTQGFEIGAHSIDHPHYADLTLAEQVRQTEHCAADLKARFGLERISFAFPFTSDGVDQQFFDDMLRRDVVDLIFCVGGMPVNSRRLLQRTWMETDSHMPVSRIIRHSYARKLSGQISHQLKAAIHPRAIFSSRA
jgi:peptidoglycan/xylan/chitin deacetylase (PgdA/CDA1 family)